MINKALVIVVSILLILSIGGPASATWLNFSFDPNALIDNAATDYTTGLKATQPDARRVHDVWATPGKFYQTFSDYLGGNAQPNSGNTYANWRASLGSGEGLSAFNIWLLDNPAARSWGETLVTDTTKLVAGTTAPGWNVEVIPNPWGAGWLVQWWTTDSAKYLRPGGADIGTFSFTADVYADTNASGFDAGDPGAVAGSPYRIWFGSYNGGAGTLESDWGVRFDATGFGSASPNYGTFAASVNSGWEGVLALSGTPVPEPGSLLLLGSGLAGLAIWRHRKRAV